MIYAGLLGLTWVGFNSVPGGFIPMQDQGYIVVSMELPPGASLARTEKVADQTRQIAMEVPGVAHAVSITGFSGATRSNNSNSAAIFVTLADSGERARQGHSSDQILAELRKRTAAISEANIIVIPPPPVPGIGTGGGFKMQIQNQSGASMAELQSAANSMAAAAMAEPGMAFVYTSFSNNTPQLYADIDRTKAEILDVPLSNVFDTLQTSLGSVYVNDFNYLGRTYRVTAQADSQFRTEPEDVMRLRTRSSNGSIVPLGSLLQMRQRTAPDRVVRYNLYPSADISGSLLPGVSTGQAMATMERLAAEHLPDGFGYEWTDLSYQEKQAGNTALFIFPLCVLFVFLALSAQYESWLLPLAVILIVPMGLLFAIGGIWLMGMDNNILTQIGFIVLVALACKNAILIVEFAKAEEDSGKNRFEAAVSAARLRVRPILMTSIAFILGVIPLVLATGAGSEMRRALGTAVFSGMIGVTICGLFLTPVFYVVLRKFARHAKVDSSSATLSSEDTNEDKPANKVVGPSQTRTTPSNDYAKMYSGRPPWDINAPQPAFVEVADQVEGSVLDIGCGTGENAFYFANRGNKVTGIDFLEQPLEVARSKATDRGVDIEFIHHDALKLNDLDRHFDNIIDSGLFHGLSDVDRKRYTDSLKSVLVPGGKLHLHCFSDAEPAGEGPRRVSRQEIHDTFEDGWTIKSIEPTHFIVRDDIEIRFSDGGPKSWFCIIERDGDRIA